jgi:hypothetical protein
MDRTLLLVTGAGRSGTSTAAGALHHLGVHVPGPYLQANASNPRGFYESRWSVEFHNKLLKRANVTLTDGRPDALSLMREAVSAQDEERLVSFLSEASDGQPVTVVKDPRTSWALDLWARAATSLDLRVAHLVMLRHPAEVLGSRATHYFARTPWMGEAGFAVKNLAGWLNAMLNPDVQTRERPRAFVRYDELLSDWRTTLGRALTGLGVDVPVPTGPHAVDEFIDPDLSRHRLTWADHDLPADLTALADRVWGALDTFADCPDATDHVSPDATDPASAPLASLDAARADYAAMYLAAQRLAFDSTHAEVEAARRKATRAARRDGAPRVDPAHPAEPTRPSVLSRLRFPKRT